MGDTSIAWADKSWNALRWRRTDGVKTPHGYHCEKIAPECAHCYAEEWNLATFRGGNLLPYTIGGGDRQEVYLDPGRLVEPNGWRKPCFVFPCSMTDWLGSFVPERLSFDLLAMAAAVPRHRYLFLTKRFDRAAAWLRSIDPEAIRRRVSALVDMLAAADTTWPLPQAWIGFTVGTQARAAAARVPLSLIHSAGWRTWLSVEPLLEPVDLRPLLPFVDWVVVGGESGKNARPCSLEWIREVVRQCEAADVPPFVKQVGSRPFGPLGARRPDALHLIGNAATRWHFIARKGEDLEEWPLDLQKRLRPASMMFESVV